VEERAAPWPSAQERLRHLNEKLPSTDAHFDAIVPRGRAQCGLGLTAEQGRRLATPAGDKRDEESGKPFLPRLKELGLSLQAFSLEGGHAYDNARRAVFGQAVKLQYDSCPIIPKAWRPRWKWAVAPRRQSKATRAAVNTLGSGHLCIRLPPQRQARARA